MRKIHTATVASGKRITLFRVNDRMNKKYCVLSYVLVCNDDDLFIQFVYLYARMLVRSKEGVRLNKVK